MSLFFRQPSACRPLWLMLVLGLAFLPCSLLILAGPPDAAGIEHLIQQLGSAKFAEREAAGKRLEAIGEPALESLWKAAIDSKDVEIRRRAEALLQAIEKRIDPANTAWIEHLIQKMGSAKIAERDAANKHLEMIGEPALGSLRRVANQDKDAETRGRAQALVREIEKHVSIISLTVQPMAAPKPALRYQLLPELKEMNPGNPIHEYSRCFAEQYNFWRTKQSVDNREKWQTMPLKDLPLKELRGFGYGPDSTALRQADYAARLVTPDWQILLKLKTEGVTTLLPDVQGLRELSSALKVRLRAEIAERRFDDAITTAKTMFALARHMGEHPTLIGDLVGIAMASLTVGTLDEMIQQRGCPNLYWALTDLPNPLIDLHKGLQGDRLLVEAEFAGLEEATPMSEAQLSQVVTRGEMMKHLLEAKKKEMVGWLEARARDEAHVQAARQRLVEASLPEERVKAFPAMQAVLLDDKRQYETRRDEGMKWMGLPYWQAEAGFLASPAARDAEMTWFERRLNALGMQLQDFLRVRKAQARTEQRIALLRHVEALRLYAAEHDGELPKQLGDVKVPLPVDPFTGKPFIYRLEGPTAVIRGSPPKGEEATPVYNVRYEVTIKK